VLNFIFLLYININNKSNNIQNNSKKRVKQKKSFQNVYLWPSQQCFAFQVRRKSL